MIDVLNKYLYLISLFVDLIMRNPELDQLIELIDNAPNRQISKETIYNPPSKLYFAIKALYQSYKKSN